LANKLDVARKLSNQVHLVFVTAFDEYAVDAFEQAATDYLLKPVARDRLAETIKRLKNKLNWLQWLRVGHGDEVELVATNDVVYLQSDHKYTGVFTAHKECVVRTPLAELEKQLDPTQFWRIHRGVIVAVKEIKSAKKDMRGRYTLSLRSRTELVRSSAAYKHLFAQM